MITAVINICICMLRLYQISNWQVLWIRYSNAMEDLQLGMGFGYFETYNAAICVYLFNLFIEALMKHQQVLILKKSHDLAIIRYSQNFSHVWKIFPSICCRSCEPGSQWLKTYSFLDRLTDFDCGFIQNGVQTNAVDKHLVMVAPSTYLRLL